MQTEIQRCLKWFDSYTRDYVGRASRDILLTVQSKISHTMRVLAHVRAILEEEDVAPDLAQAAEAAAILHDVGRFPQLVDTESFDDRTGYNHAEEGERILLHTAVLNPFSETQRRRILTAVKYHNLSVLPDLLTDDERHVLEILRDADKLDAIRNMVKYTTKDSPYGKALKTGLDWHETEVSRAVAELALQRRLVPYDSIKWSNDFALFVCCWIYDLHFPYAYLTLIQSGNYEALLAWMPDTTPFDLLKKQFREDLEGFTHRGGRLKQKTPA